MYRYFHGSDRSSIPTGLPSRLVDPTLKVVGEKPQFLKIGEGNEPRNELLRVVNQDPSKDEVRTKVLSEMFARNDKDPYFNRPDNIAAIRAASQELGIPLEKTGLRIAVDPFRLEGDVVDVNLLAQITNKAAGNLKRSGKPTVANALTRKAEMFSKPRSYRELAVEGTEGIPSILDAVLQAEPYVAGTSQGLRPILNQAGGLDANIGIKSGSPENIPPMDIEGMKGANRYVDISQGAQTARVIQYPNIYDRLNKGAQPVVTPTIPYSADIPTGQEFILSPKVSIETKRPRFIDLREGQSLAGQIALLRRATKGLKVQGEGVVNLLDLVKAEQSKGSGIYTRSGELINAEQKNLLDTGMADLEDRSFILRDPVTVNRTPIRALASALPPNYYSQRGRNIPVTPEAIPPTRMARDINNTPVYYSELPQDYYGLKRDIPNEDRAKYSLRPTKGNWATGVTVIDETKPLTNEIGSIIGYKPTAEEYRDSKRLGFEILGMGQKSKSTLNIPEKITYALEDGTINKNLWGAEVEVPTGKQAINKYIEPNQSKEVTAVIPARRMSDSMSDRILHVPGYLQRYEPFKSNTNTYGARDTKTPWREYYSDPFVYEDKGLDSEVNRLMKAVNEAPAQLENAYTQQSSANRRAIDASDKLKMLGQHQSVRMGLLPQGEGVVNLAREIRKDRRMAENDAAKANDAIAQLKAAQELMGVEYMVKPKAWGEDVLNDYALAARTKGAMKDSSYSEQAPTTDSLKAWRSALDDKAQEAKFARQYSEPDRDYDIASLFGFTGNY